MKISTINSEGQIVIPAEIRKTLNLRTGDKVAFEIEDDVIKMIPVLDDVTAAFGLLKANKSVTLQDIEQAIEDEAVERYLLRSS